MFNRLKAMFRAPQPAGPPETVSAFGPDAATIARDTVTAADGAWCVAVKGERSVPLFEVPMAPGSGGAMLTYRARMRAQGLQGTAYLEMWCRLPGQGRFFSKGLDNALSGTSGWAEFEIPFYLRPGQNPDLVQLNLFAAGTGQVWIKDIALLRTPLA
ncbi:MAG: hypothetical protein QNJ44_10350 [Rhodobacter sp.]|nr:hypothetical protein [Rhodobacter sp.]